MTTTSPAPTSADTLARAGASAIESYFETRGAKAVSAGDGRYTVYIPGGEGTEDLQLSLASTPASRGILARVKARRVVAPGEWNKALVFANQWNRSSPLPHVVHASRGSGEGAVGTLFLEGYLPPSADVNADEVRRFIDTVVAGSRQFWSSGAVKELSRPVGGSAATAEAGA